MGSCLCRCGRSSGDEGEDEIEPQRKIRDVVWAFLFIAFWAGSWSYSSLAIKEGDPGLLIYGLDYDGNVCNRNQVRHYGGTGPLEAARLPAHSHFVAVTSVLLFLLTTPRPRGNVVPSVHSRVKILTASAIAIG